MNKALAASGGLALVAFVALFQAPAAPAGLADPLGTLLRTALTTAMLVLLGRLVGTAAHRKPARPMATRVVVAIVLTVAIEVTAIWASPNWSVALAVWYFTLFVLGVALNLWCDAPERYPVLVAAFVVFLSSLILIALAAASPMLALDMAASTASLSIWRNVTRMAGHPSDAAWVWLAWRIADRLRAPEAKRPKAPGTFVRTPITPKRPA
ncbi:MAG: hypothetical protein ABI672_18605 [Vicinamibacteria bacterium]